MPARLSSFLGVYDARSVVDSENTNFIWASLIFCGSWRLNFLVIFVGASTMCNSYVLAGLGMDAMLSKGHLFGDMSMIGVRGQLDV